MGIFENDNLKLRFQDLGGKLYHVTVSDDKYKDAVMQVPIHTLTSQSKLIHKIKVYKRYAEMRGLVSRFYLRVKGDTVIYASILMSNIDKTDRYYHWNISISMTDESLFEIPECNLPVYEYEELGFKQSIFITQILLHRTV